MFDEHATPHTNANEATHPIAKACNDFGTIVSLSGFLAAALGHAGNLNYLVDNKPRRDNYQPYG